MSAEESRYACLTFVFGDDGPRGVRFGETFWALEQKHRGRLPEPPPWGGYYDALPKKLSLRLFDMWFLASRPRRPNGAPGVLVAELVMLPSWNTHEAKGDPIKNAISWIRNRGSDSVLVEDCELGPVVEAGFPSDAVCYEPVGAEVDYARGLDIAMGRASPAAADPWLQASAGWPRLFGVDDVRVVADFTGRDRELALLRDRLLSAHAASPPPVAVCGPSGIGKTQLVAAFLTQNAARFEHILLVHASGADLTIAIGRWAAHFDSGAPTLRTPIQSAERVREVLERGGPSLLVLDDVTDERAAVAWLPRRGACRVVMTTQLPLVDGARTLTLAPLEPEQATALLKWHLPDGDIDPRERAAVDSVCEYFGYSPFPLHVASVYMGRHALQPSELLRRIRAGGPDVISDVGTDVAGYSRSVDRVFGLALDQLAADQPTPVVLGHPLAHVTAWVCGLVEAAPAPYALILATVAALARDAAPREAIDAALAALARRSMIRVDRGEVYVHALPGRFFEASIAPPLREAVLDAYLVELAALTRRARDRVALLPHLARARELVATLPRAPGRHPIEVELLTTEAQVLMQMHGYAAPDAAPIFRRSAELVPHMRPTPELFALEHMRWVQVLIEARLDEALAIAEGLVELAGVLGVAALEAAALQARGAVLSFQGRHPEAIPTLERGIALADATPAAREATRQAQDPRVTCRCDLARSYVMVGRPDAALRLVHAALEIAAEHPFSEAFALFNMTMLRQYRREPEQAHQAAQELLAVCGRFGFRQFDLMGRIFLGWSIASLGVYEAGVEVSVMAMEHVVELNAHIARGADTTLLAELHLGAGRVDAARVALQRSDAHLARTGEGYYAPERHRLEALTVLAERPDAYHEAERALARALDLA
ncbi:MAG: hypothetical protein EP329_06875, partial [Deltaproteobacteria bacterium]